MNISHIPTGEQFPANESLDRFSKARDILAKIGQSKLAWSSIGGLALADLLDDTSTLRPATLAALGNIGKFVSENWLQGAEVEEAGKAVMPIPESMPVAHTGEHPAVQYDTSRVDGAIDYLKQNPDFGQPTVKIGNPMLEAGGGGSGRFDGAEVGEKVSMGNLLSKGSQGMGELLSNANVGLGSDLASTADQITLSN